MGTYGHVPQMNSSLCSVSWCTFDEMFSRDAIDCFVCCSPGGVPPSKLQFQTKCLCTEQQAELFLEKQTCVTVQQVLL